MYLFTGITTIAVLALLHNPAHSQAQPVDEEQLVFSHHTAAQSYEYGQVYRCRLPASDDRAQALLEAVDRSDCADLWASTVLASSSSPSSSSSSSSTSSSSIELDIRIADGTHLLALTMASGISREATTGFCSLWIADVAERVRMERLGRSGWDYLEADKHAELLSVASSSSSSTSTLDDLAFYRDFRPFGEMMAHVRALVDEHSTIARLVPSIARTHEGRDILVVHVTAPSSSSPSSSTFNNNSTTHKTSTAKPIIWFNGGIHAREWISSHTAVFVLERLLRGYARADAEVVEMLEQFEFVVAPHVNPDGYEWSRTSDRMWRKNRRSNGRLNGFGVDLNRNFNVRWATGGSSSRPLSDTYHGPSAASEPEVHGLQEYITATVKGRALLSIDFHSYGQLLLRPYGFSMDDHPQEAVIKRLGDGMRDTIAAYSGTTYTSQKSAGLYPVSGGFDDWMTVEAGTWGFTIELRDRGMHGFLLPRDQIVPTGEEIWEAFRYMCKFVAGEQQRK